MTGTPQRTANIVAVGFIAGVGAFSTDAYLPALPAIARSLQTSAFLAQLTVTSCIIGLAIGQLLAGSSSDALGRRPVLLGASVVFLITSVVAAGAPNIELLIVMRFAQGAAAGACAAVAQAVVSDQYEGAAAAKRFGTLAVITLLAPVVAPTVGGAILTIGDWRVVLLFMAALGVIMLVAVLTGIPETIHGSATAQSTGQSALARIADLLGDREFRSPVLVLCLATAGFFVYIGGSSFVLQAGLGVDESLYAVIFAVNAAAMVLATIAFRAFVGRFGVRRLRLVGLTLSTTASAGLLIVGLTLGAASPVAVVWALLAVAVGGMGLSQPTATILAQQAGRRSAGTAASLVGGLAFLTGALTTPLTGAIGTPTVSLMGALMVGFLAIAVTLVLIDRPAGTS